MTLFDRRPFSTINRMEDTLREMSIEAFQAYRRLAPKTETRHERVFLLGMYIARLEVPAWQHVEVFPNVKFDGWRPDFIIVSDGFLDLIVEISATPKIHLDRERLDNAHDLGFQITEYLNEELENEDGIMQICRRILDRRTY